MIYLDYSANTPADPAVLEGFCRTEQTYPGNPNSTHLAGQAARQEMARATEALAVATEKALELALTNQARRAETVQGLNRRLRAALGACPQVRFNSPENAVPHILNLSVTGVKGTVFQRALSQRGICVSVKSACSGEGTPSQAVLAVSRDRKNALSSWRVSLSHLTTQEEIDQFLQALGQCLQALQA